MEDLTYRDCEEIDFLKNNLSVLGSRGNKYPGMFNQIIYQNAGVIHHVKEAFANTEKDLLEKYCELDEEGNVKKKKNKDGRMFTVIWKSEQDELKYLLEIEEIKSQVAGKFQIRKAPQGLLDKLNDLEEDYIPIPGMETFYRLMVEEPKKSAE